MNELTNNEIVLITGGELMVLSPAISACGYTIALENITNSKTARIFEACYDQLYDETIYQSTHFRSRRAAALILIGLSTSMLLTYMKSIKL